MLFVLFQYEEGLDVLRVNCIMFMVKKEEIQIVKKINIDQKGFTSYLSDYGIRCEEDMFKRILVVHLGSKRLLNKLLEKRLFFFLGKQLVYI